MMPYRRPSAASCASAIVPAGQSVIPGQIPQTQQTLVDFISATVVNGPTGLVGVMPYSYPQSVQFNGPGRDSVWWAFRLSQQTDRPAFVAWTNAATIVDKCRRLMFEKIRRGERTYDGTAISGVLSEPNVPKIDRDLLRRMWVWLRDAKQDGYAVAQVVLDSVARCAREQRVDEALSIALLLTAFHTGGPTGGSEMQILSENDLAIYLRAGSMPRWDYPIVGAETQAMDRAVILPLQYAPATGISRIESWRTLVAPAAPLPPPVPSSWTPVSPTPAPPPAAPSTSTPSTSTPSPTSTPTSTPAVRTPLPPGSDPWRVQFQPFYDPSFTGKPPVAPTLPGTPAQGSQPAPGTPAPVAPAPVAPAPAPTSPIPPPAGQRGIVLTASAVEAGREWLPYAVAGSITMLLVGTGYYLYKRSQRGAAPILGEF